MDYDDFPESPKNFSPLEKVKIERVGTWKLRAVNGTVATLREFQDKAKWQYIEFGARKPLAIIIHEVDFDSPFLSSGRGDREASLRYRQYVLYWNGWTISLPEYWITKIHPVRSWGGIKRVLDSIRKLAGSSQE